MARAYQLVTAELARGTAGFSYDDYDRALIGQPLAGRRYSIHVPRALLIQYGLGREG